MDRIQRAKEICDYAFDDGEYLLKNALAAAGSLGAATWEGNKVLALVGDAVIAIHVRTQGVNLGWSISKSTLRLQEIANNNRLETICHFTGLADCIDTHPGQFGPLGRNTTSATIEALVGAAYKIGGMADAEKVMRTLGII